MASGTKLAFVFETSSGKESTISFSNAKPTVTTAEVLALGNAIINNNTILDNTYTAIKSAKLITTTEQIFDLNDTTRTKPYSEAEAYARGLIGDEDNQRLTIIGPTSKIVSTLPWQRNN